MIAAWMVYSVAVSAVLGVCALALERGLRRSGMPVRWLWVGALLGSLALGAAPWVASGRGASTPVAEREAELMVFETVIDAPAAQPAIVGGAPAWRGALSRVGVVDRPLLALWALGTAAGVLYLIGAHRTLSRRRRIWRKTTLEGVPALVSRDVGPAVVGFIDAAIVVPHWVVGLDPERRRLVLAHEEEHLRAGDARLLSLALLALAVAPWNAALWWQLRRLRHAVELDCDARVLDGEADAERYCELLIEVGERASMRGVAFAAFAESSSFLERRILSMVGPRPRRWTLAAGLCVTVAGFLALYACEAPIPTLPEAELEAEPELVVYDAEVVPTEVDTTVLWTGEVELEPVVEEDTVAVGAPDRQGMEWADVTELVRRRHPDVYSGGLPLERAIWFAVDAEGRIVRSWLGPNLYINFHGGYAPLDPHADRTAELARAQETARAQVRARVPGMQVRGVAAAHFYSGPESRPRPFTVHFFTETSGIPAADGGLDHADRVVNRAIAAELAR